MQKSVGNRCSCALGIVKLLTFQHVFLGMLLKIKKQFRSEHFFVVFFGHKFCFIFDLDNLNCAVSLRNEIRIMNISE